MNKVLVRDLQPLKNSRTRRVQVWFQFQSVLNRLLVTLGRIIKGYSSLPPVNPKYFPGLFAALNDANHALNVIRG